MVSFDVVSLFTRVPLKEAMEVIFARLEHDETLEERTNIPVHDICHLTEICLTSTYFQFQDAFYEQVDGAAMGSPLSPIVANIYMESMETRALEAFHAKPKLWVRYVDDTFVLWQHGEEKLETFHEHLNSQHPSIQFTKEVECDNKIPFLDVLIERTGTRVTTRVYRKKTHTDQYIHYTSHHHHRAKSGTIKCLKYRMDKICNAKSKQEEINHIRKAFRNNGYPDKFITRALQNPTQPTETPEEENSERPKILSLPYCHGLSERIQRVCGRIGVKAVFKSHHTLREKLTRVKTPRPDLLKRSVVYEVPCLDCEKVYVGETKRNLKQRLMEHKGAVRREDRKNGIATHAWDEDHRVNWQEARVVTVEPSYWKRRMREALRIQSVGSTSNLDCGLTLDPVWLQFLDRIRSP